MSTTNNSDTDSTDEQDDQQSADWQQAYRMFAAEFNESTYQFDSDPDNDRSPKYVVGASGVNVNRVLISGTVTEIKDVANDDDDTYLRARIVDGSGEGNDDLDGVFYVYAGQYQPEALATLEQLETPKYVTVMGKPRTFEGEEDEETGEAPTYVSIRPEFVQQVSKADRDKWAVETAEDTLDRLKYYSDNPEDDAVQTARERYDTDPGILREGVKSALRNVIDDA